MFWAKDLDAILSAVPNHSNFKYLTKEQTVKLKLKQLQYNEKLLLVRNEYKMAYEMICLDKNNKHFRMGGVVITGQPGAGMHLSLIVIFFLTFTTFRQNMLSILFAVLPVEQGTACGTPTGRYLCSF